MLKIFTVIGIIIIGGIMCLIKKNFKILYKNLLELGQRPNMLKKVASTEPIFLKS
jgi:hypothetical protein